MGQSAILNTTRDTSAKRVDMRSSETVTQPRLAVFQTDLGWFGLLGIGQRILALSIGHTSKTAVRSVVRLKNFQADYCEADSIEDDWSPDIRARLEQYAAGRKVDFSDCRLLIPRLTPFQEKVVAATQKIGYGQTVTYGQLASKAGFPRAARAVGSVMAANRVPIIIPCHRVVASDGKLGGFSAPQGVSLKECMLNMEAGRTWANTSISSHRD